MSAPLEGLTILAAIAALSLVEAAFPFKRARFSTNRIRLNLALTALTLAVNFVMSGLIIAALLTAESAGRGLLPLFIPPGEKTSVLIIALTAAALDLAFYVSHVAMHRSPLLWRFHSLHHSDETIDATTSFRQHPVEGGFRYAAIGATAFALGASPEAYLFYRFASALSAVLEHANIAVPTPVARALALVTSWPLMHKIHHSSLQTETDSNYGNLLSIWDRIFSTYTPLVRAGVAPYGIFAPIRKTLAEGVELS